MLFVEPFGVITRLVLKPISIISALSSKWLGSQTFTLVIVGSIPRKVIMIKISKRETKHWFLNGGRGRSSIPQWRVKAGNKEVFADFVKQKCEIFIRENNGKIDGKKLRLIPPNRSKQHY